MDEGGCGGACAGELYDTKVGDGVIFCTGSEGEEQGATGGGSKKGSGSCCAW